MSRPHHILSIKPFEAQDIDELTPCALALREMAAMDRHALADIRARDGRGFTARDGRGRVVCCAGASVVHQHYATLWAFYAEGIGAATAARLIKATRHFIDKLSEEFARVDAFASSEAPQAAKWAMACGLSFEARLAHANPAGGDFLVYRKVRA